MPTVYWISNVDERDQTKTIKFSDGRVATKGGPAVEMTSPELNTLSSRYVFSSAPSSSGPPPSGPPSSLPADATGFQHGDVPVYDAQARAFVPVAAHSIDWVPEDNSLDCASIDPALASGEVALTAGLIHAWRVHLIAVADVNDILLRVSSAGSSPGNAWAAIYSAEGAALEAATAEVSGILGATGDKVLALTTPATLAAGEHLVAVCVGSGTPPSLAGISSGRPNFSLTASTARCLTAQSGYNNSSPPASLTGLAAAGGLALVGLI